MWGQGKPEKNLDVVVGEELCGVTCCMGSGVVTFDARNRTTKQYRFLFFFEQYILKVILFGMYRSFALLLCYSLRVRHGRHSSTLTVALNIICDDLIGREAARVISARGHLYCATCAIQQ